MVFKHIKVNRLIKSESNAYAALYCNGMLKADENYSFDSAGKYSVSSMLLKRSISLQTNKMLRMNQNSFLS